MLAAAVHRTETRGLSEPAGWFAVAQNTSPLVTGELIFEDPLSSHGVPAFDGYVAADDHIARFTVHAHLDDDQTYSWFKETEPASFAQWFAADVTPTTVCHDPELTDRCTEATISAYEGDTTSLDGMELPEPYCTACAPIHMRLDVNGSSGYSGICSSTGDDPDWADSFDAGGHWGNALTIWLRRETVLLGSSSEFAALSCKDILDRGDSSGDGSYWVDPDGSGAFEVFCDMSTDGGGWTEIYLAADGNLDSGTPGIPYDVSDTTLVGAASDVLIAYRNSGGAVDGDFATFAIPTEWRVQSPMQYSRSSATAEVSVNGAAVGSRTVYYGTCDFESPCGDNWGSCSSSWLHGRVCIAGTTAPYWAFWAGPTAVHVDACDTSEFGGEGDVWDSCEALGRRFSILVR